MATKTKAKKKNDNPVKISKKPKGTRKTLVLLDAHAILHRAYHALPDFAKPFKVGVSWTFFY